MNYYFKKLFKVLVIVIAGAVLAMVVGYWVFEGDWPFIWLPLLVGAGMSLVQQENRSYKFIGKLVIGSLIFGFLAMFLICLRMYLIIHPLDPTMPLIFNTKDFFTLSLAFSFVSFLGGLISIVFKGFYFLKK